MGLQFLLFPAFLVAVSLAVFVRARFGRTDVIVRADALIRVDTPLGREHAEWLRGPGDAVFVRALDHEIGDTHAPAVADVVLRSSDATREVVLFDRVLTAEARALGDVTRLVLDQPS